MIQINLLPEEMRKRESQKIVLPEIPIKKTLIILVLSVLGIQIAFSAVTAVLSFQLAAAKKQAEMLELETKPIQRQKSEIHTIGKKLASLRNVTDRKFYWASLLAALSKSVTKGIWLRSLEIQTAEVKDAPPPVAAAAPSRQKTPPPAPEKPDVTLLLEGSVLAPGQETAHVGRFMKSLQDNPLLAKVFSDIRLATMAQKRIKERDIFEFTLVCKFRKS